MGKGKESGLEYGDPKSLKKKDEQAGDGQHEGEVQSSVRSQAMDALRVKELLSCRLLVLLQCLASVSLLKGA